MNISPAAELHPEYQYQKGKKKDFPNTGQRVCTIIRQHIQVAEWHDIINKIIQAIVDQGFLIEYKLLAKHI